MIIPLFVKANPADLVNQVYFTGVGAATVLWAFATLFLFYNALRFVQKSRDLIRQAKLFPLPVLCLACLIGIVTGVVAIIDTLLNSWTPLVSNSSWFLLTIGIVLTVLILGSVASMVSTSEASFEQMRE